MTPCIEWAGVIDTNGYGRTGPSCRQYAHREMYTVLVGPIPVGLHIDHLCRNRACVNPEHLEPVTPAENKRRGMGPCAINARKTHCKHGHEFTPENTKICKNGSRRCRICSRASVRKWYAKQKTTA